MTLQQLLPFLLSISFGAGINVYATVATLGLLQRAAIIQLPSSLSVVSSWWVIGISLTMFLLEFVADKIPYVDLVWNVLHTFVRVPVAAVMTWAATPDLGPGWQVAAAALSGAVALIAHGGKLAVRAAVTPSPEPASNIALSLGEDAFTIFLTWFATAHPYIAATIVFALLVVSFFVLRWIVRALRAAFTRRASRPA
jgi:Domain of unknown function (DUF4126)